MQKGVATRIVANDRIMFGRFENEWVLSKLYFKTFTSLLSEEKKEKLLKMFQSIGFDVIDAWQQGSTHLTMASTTAVTVKLLQALAAGIPIVTVKFWMEVVKAIAKNEPLPDYTMHMPTLSEPFLESVSLDLNSKRKQLFAGMVFVFMSNTQMESFKDIIELAGGSCLGLRGKQFKKTILLDNKYVAMQYNPSAQTQMSQSHKLMDVLKSMIRPRL